MDNYTDEDMAKVIRKLFKEPIDSLAERFKVDRAQIIDWRMQLLYLKKERALSPALRKAIPGE